jgi:predicted peptidase
MRLVLRTALLLGLSAFTCAAQSQVDGFIARVYKSGGRQSMPYRLFVPAHYKPDIQYPLVLWLHGAGGAGTDNRGQISGDQVPGTRTWTKPQNQTKYPSFVLVPQSPTNWVSSGLDRLSPEMSLVLAILQEVRSEFNIDPARMYVAGQSDGGIGTWNVIIQRPNLFAAAIPLCGGGDYSRAAAIAKLPLWAFHGARDNVISVAESRKMINALQKAGGRPRYTEYGNVGHDVWNRAFAEPELVDWLFAQHR